MPILTGEEKKDLIAVVHDMGERALRQVLFGLLNTLEVRPSVRTEAFIQCLDEARKYDAMMKGRS